MQQQNTWGFLLLLLLLIHCELLGVFIDTTAVEEELNEKLMLCVYCVVLLYRAAKNLIKPNQNSGQSEKEQEDKGRLFDWHELKQWSQELAQVSRASLMTGLSGAETCLWTFLLTL